MTSQALTDSLRETLALFDGSGTPRTTSELADALDIGRRSTYERLERLVEHGELETKSVGASARVWWRPQSSTVDRSSDSGDRPDRAQFRTLVDAIEEYAICLLDPNGRVRTWNAGAERITGYATDDVLGKHVSMLHVADDGSAVVPETALETAAETGAIETDGCCVRADGSTFRANVTVDAIRDGEGELEGFATVVRDATERRETECQLRRQRDIVELLFETAPVQMLITDAKGTIERLNSRARRNINPDRDGSDDSMFAWDALDLYDAEGDSIPIEEHPVTTAIETEEPVSERGVQYDPDGDRRWVTLTASPVFGDDGNVERVVVTGKDITERRRTHRQLERQLDELEAELGEVYRRIDDAFFALDDDLRFTHVNLRASEFVGRRPQDLVGERVGDVELGPKANAAFEEAMQTQQPVSVEEYHESSEAWFEHHVYPSETGLSVHVRDVTQRKTRERTLKRQREQLEALNNLNDVVRGIIDAVTERSTREKIERDVCEHLTATESYLFAWIGDVDVTSQTVVGRTEAGVNGYLDGISISVDPADERSKGPTGRAVLEREIQTTQDIRADARHDPWRSHIEEYGFRSSAAIPIVHEDTIYGVLNVYADRPRAFEGRERDVISQLGEVIGHAIAAAERKQALMSDAVVELQFRIRDVFDALDVDGPSTGTITLDHAVPIENDEYLIYGSATADAIDGLEALVETLPHWVNVTYRTGGDERGFELRLSEPPVLSTVASIGGSVETAVIEDGDYMMTLHVAPGTDVRQVVDTVREAYPEAELLKQRHQRIDADERAHDVLTTALTDRQQAVLEATYHAGYYEWPRDASGEEIAESLDIAPPTFHQHLRKAQRTVFDSLLSSPGRSRSAE